MTFMRAIGSTCLLGFAAAAIAGLPPVPTPQENPLTEDKHILGKILFWDEQLSSDHTVAGGPAGGKAERRSEQQIALGRRPPRVRRIDRLAAAGAASLTQIRTVAVSHYPSLTTPPDRHMPW
jgi:hypothetical protein